MGSSGLWTIVPGAPDFFLNCINLGSSVLPCVEETTDGLSQIILHISNYVTVFFFLVPIHIFFRRLIPMGTPKTDDPKHLLTKINCSHLSLLCYAKYLLLITILSSFPSNLKAKGIYLSSVLED